jgi:hypothetical protein
MKRREFLQNCALAPAVLTQQRVNSSPLTVPQSSPPVNAERVTLLLDPETFRHYVDALN